MKLYNANNDLKQVLQTFWDIFGGIKNDGSKQNYAKKLFVLQDYAKKTIYRKKYRGQKERKKFDYIKKKRHSLKTHSICFLCSENEAEVRHHIILLKNGGTNCKKNVISLCRECHALIHPWLAGGEN